MRVATDVGGTFTDLVYYDEGSGTFGSAKSDTTPEDYARGVMNTLERARIEAGSVDFFAHGTTVVINALTERKGARVGLITTRGFRDVLEIARGNRPDLFNFYFSKPKPFVERHLRRELPERVNYKGEVLTPLDLSELDAILSHFREEDVGSIAVCFLHAYANPEHELRTVAAIHEAWPEVSVLASHQITREWREYERTSTAVLSAFVHPIAGRYLDSLNHQLEDGGFKGRFYVMQSNGGIATRRAAKDNPISLVESGPVSGILGAVALGELIGEQNVIALDIGGTTAKCALVEQGRPRVTTDYKIEWTRTNPGYPIKTPVIDVVEIGNGGGSIAWIDEGGSLHVGPQSAGADPGPAAYGRGGTEPTTTDANLLTGRIDPDYFLGGEIVPNLDNVRAAFDSLAERLDVNVEEAARGVIRIANANMVNALKLVSLNRGYDPRDFTLVAFGGGGAMHAAALAVELGIPKVIIPPNPAVFSAWGMLLTDLRRDYIMTNLVRLDRSQPKELTGQFRALEKSALADFRDDGLDEALVSVQRQADLRYLGQEHTVKVDAPAGDFDDAAVQELIRRFHEAHEREYTFRLESPVELVNFHLVAYGAVSKPEIAKLDRSGASVAAAVKGEREVDFDVAGIHRATTYERARLEPGMELIGPAVIEEPATTIVVFPNQQVRVDDYGNLHIRTLQEDG